MGNEIYPIVDGSCSNDFIVSCHYYLPPEQREVFLKIYPPTSRLLTYISMTELMRPMSYPKNQISEITDRKTMRSKSRDSK